MQLVCAPLQTSLPLLPAVLTGTQKSKHSHATSKVKALQQSCSHLLCIRASALSACLPRKLQDLGHQARACCAFEGPPESCQHRWPCQVQMILGHTIAPNLGWCGTLGSSCWELCHSILLLAACGSAICPPARLLLLSWRSTCSVTAPLLRRKCAA